MANLTNHNPSLNKLSELDRGACSFPPSREVLEQCLHDIIDNTAAVIYVKDVEGRYLLVNQQYTSIFGLDRPQIIGKTDFDLFDNDVAESFRVNDTRVFESGAAIQLQEVAPQKDGDHTYVSIKFPLRDQFDRIYAVAGISTDITRRVKAEAEREQIANQLKLILDSVGEGVFGVDMEGLTTFVNESAEQMIGLTAARIQGREQHDLLHPVRSDGRPYSIEECPICSVIRDGQPRTRAGDLLFNSSQEPFPTEYVCTPIREGASITGAVVTFRDLTEQYQQRRIERELKAAEAVQQRLYPKGPPQLAGFEMAGDTFPAEVTCGDYYDFIPLADGSVVVAVGDVCGHGLGPALHMVETRAYLRALLNSGVSLESALDQLNHLLVEDMASESFLSLFLLQLWPDCRTVTYAAAGHDARVLRRGGRVTSLDASGLVLGLTADVPLPVRSEVEMAPGDLLILPTDGLMETMGPEDSMFSWKRVLDVAIEHFDRSPRELIARLNLAATRYSQRSDRRDDVTIVVIRAL